ncbi:DUF6492 family protein [Naumannella halotolerans]
MEVQAMSIDKCFDPDLVSRIMVVVNEPTHAAEDETVLQFEKHVLQRYGQFKDKVTLLRASQFGDLSEKGWLTQQACKLAVAKHSTSEYYVVLDAKNHAIRPVGAATLFDSTGVPTKIFTKTRQDQRPWLDASFSYLGEQNLIPSYRCPSSAPPFPIRTSVCSDLVDLIEDKESTNITSFFLNKQDVSTEFTLYVAYTAKIGMFADCLRNGRSTYASLRGKIDRAKIADTKARIENANVWCFSVHRRAFRDIRERTLRTIAQAWAIALFPTFDEALASAHQLADKLSDVKDFTDLRERELKS